jgi:hypothetical protein
MDKFGRQATGLKRREQENFYMVNKEKINDY